MIIRLSPFWVLLAAIGLDSVNFTLSINYVQAHSYREKVAVIMPDKLDSC